MHAEIRIGNARIMLNDVMTAQGPEGVATRTEDLTPQEMEQRRAAWMKTLPEFDPSQRSSCAVHGISDAHDVLTRCRVLPTM